MTAGAAIEWFDNEHPALRKCWHPIGEVGEFDGAGPHAVRLIGENLVLWQSPEGWSLLPDRCPHRLAPLTQGSVDEGTLRCAYHGWCFSGAGSCVEIPALGPGATIPPKAHLPAARVAERYGLLWAALDEPIAPLPEIAGWGDDAYGLVRLPPQEWRAGAAQIADNFLDVAHFPFTHTATIGDENDRIVDDYQVKRHGWSFTAHHEHDAQVLDGSGRIERRTMDFECFAPHHVSLRLGYEDDAILLLFFHQPVDYDTTRVFVIQLTQSLAHDPSLGPDTIAFQMAVGKEDRDLLETLETKGVPLSPGVETHTRADRITVELRRVLADLAAAAEV